MSAHPEPPGESPDEPPGEPPGDESPGTPAWLIPPADNPWGEPPRPPKRERMPANPWGEPAAPSTGEAGPPPFPLAPPPERPAWTPPSPGGNPWTEPVAQPSDPADTGASQPLAAEASEPRASAATPETEHVGNSTREEGEPDDKGTATGAEPAIPQESAPRSDSAGPSPGQTPRRGAEGRRRRGRKANLERRAGCGESLGSVWETGFRHDGAGAAASGGTSAERPEGEGTGGDAEARAREICLRMLTAAPRTRAQLADALRRKKVPDEVAERVLGRFTAVGLIDDEAFAQAWVQSRHRGRGLGKRALAAELRRRGVADETVKEAVQSLGPEEEERTARELIARRLPATRGLDTAKRTRRLVGVLARKGYPPGLAYRVVREVLEEDGADDVPEGEWDLE
ncbi:RecX family transcriptional regulator [Actinomadura sp. NBRC 104425]|uniref:regulatory protein RecX n=1 Tax=Actinomadura sp. NBRC 104425 TaxID=3032204 RepID=UPI0033289BB5